jgi:hypothetical protein
VKVKLWEKNLLKKSLNMFYLFLSAVAVFLSFVDLDARFKVIILALVVILSFLYHIYKWKKVNNLSQVNLKINNSDLEIKFGDIFDEESNKLIPMNEYYDTTFENRLISRTSIHGQLLDKMTNDEIAELDKELEDQSLNHLVEDNLERPNGKIRKFDLGTIIIYKKYFLLALTHFNNDNEAELTMNEYVRCLLNMWKNIDKHYNGETICIPLLGSGQTRMRDNTTISDSELLDIMIWTFRISKVKFTYPSKMKIILLPEKKDKFNLFKIKEDNYGV